MATVIHTENAAWKQQWRNWLDSIDRDLFLLGTHLNTGSILDNPGSAETDSLVSAIAHANGNTAGVIEWDEDVGKLQATTNAIIAAALQNAYPDSCVTRCDITGHNCRDVNQTVAAWADFRDHPSPATQQVMRQAVARLLADSPALQRDLIWNGDRVLAAIDVIGTYNNPMLPVEELGRTGGIHTVIEHRLKDGLAAAGIQDGIVNQATISAGNVDEALQVARITAEHMVIANAPYLLAAPDTTTDVFQERCGDRLDDRRHEDGDPALASATQAYLRAEFAPRAFTIEAGSIQSATEHRVIPAAGSQERH